MCAAGFENERTGEIRGRDLAGDLEGLLESIENEDDRDAALEDGIGVLWTTLLVDEVRPDDQVVVLHKGKVLASDTARAIMAAAGVTTIGAAFTKLTGGAGEDDK